MIRKLILAETVFSLSFAVLVTAKVIKQQKSDALVLGELRYYNKLHIPTSLRWTQVDGYYGELKIIQPGNVLVWMPGDFNRQKLLADFENSR